MLSWAIKYPFHFFLLLYYLNAILLTLFEDHQGTVAIHNVATLKIMCLIYF